MKRCRKCGKRKPITEFYKNKPMPDGRLNHCRDCFKQRSHQYWREVSSDPVRLERVRERGRGLSKQRLSTPATRLIKSRWAKRNKFKRRAHHTVLRAVRSGRLIRPSKCDNCGHHRQHIGAHHEDYTKPLKVIWLCPACHGKTYRKPFGSPVNRRSTQPV